MRQVKRVPEDPELFERLLLTRAVAVVSRPTRKDAAAVTRTCSIITE